MFKFDPKTITVHPSSWTKKTIGSSLTNCGHLGLILGRGESFLYAFSMFNSLSTVTLLDINGISIWQYSTPGGNQNEGNLIKFKEIDTATDMIIATTGLGASINYNRIISSTSSPSFSIVPGDSKAYKDTTLTTYKRLRGLFIIDKDNIVSLMYDTFRYETHLATLNFANLSVTYKATLPIINKLMTTVFFSASVYYSPS